MKHRPRDLVRTGSIFAQKTILVAQVYAPSLIIDAAPLGLNQFGIVSDFNILIYALLPNPLYKQKKHYKISTSKNIIQSDEFEYLPLCAVLSANIRTTRHYSFILRCNAGLNSIFSGLQHGFIQKMYRNLELMKQSNMSITAPLVDPSDLKQYQNNQNKQNSDERIDQQIQKYEQAETEDNDLYAEDLENDYYLHMNNPKQSIIELLSLSKKESMQCLPQIPSFTMISKSGAILRCVPSNYEKIPINDIFNVMHIYALIDQNFGDIWKQPQIQIFNDYWRVEEQTFRLTVIEKAIREYVATGRIARRPPNSLSQYLPPMYFLRGGSRYLEFHPIQFLQVLQIGGF
ncbi:MAG: hypothetical protein EZS28_007507 [Streblomastix strix]|uniref:Uncharacterized protein n=1 Tax=Streblomastix strix TaxID=222440 RepID=A0A5J4WRE9_9EUKA|nr:MAG: hypothetical protein EZS28_007507 [Streblomastix strix]